MQSRRDFLKISAATGSAMALAPAGISHAAEGAAPTMVIARCKTNPQAEAEIKAMAVNLTKQAVDALGGMPRFVKKGETVWIKPNVGWDRTPEQAANTNPDVVGTLVALCLEAGAQSVKVGDFTCNEAAKSYPNSGIEAAVKAAGGEIVYIDKGRFREMNVGGQVLKKWPVYPEIAESDVVINVPVVKHHTISTMTAAMKNYMGIADNRNKWHQNLPTCLCDITRFMQPKSRLVLIDAIRILTANGPTGGDLADVKRMDTIAAGTDIVALDAFAAELLGHKPADIASVAAGHAAKLGTMDYRSLNPKEIEVA